MYRFDTSWFYKILSTLYRDVLRLVPTYRERFYLSWGVCSITLVFAATQLLFFWRHVLNAFEQPTNLFLLEYIDYLLLIGLFITWQWGVWYWLKLGLLYWMKDRLPLWANSSIISCILMATANWICFSSSTYRLSVGVLPMNQVCWLLVTSFIIGAFLPTLNNQRWPNKYFA